MSIDCIICGNQTAPFLKKHFDQFALGEVAYLKCTHCGFVLSATHYQMTHAEWQELNRQWVGLYQGSDHNPEDPRWLERLDATRRVLADCAELGLLPQGQWLDYGAGDGKLADALHSRHGLNFSKYEHDSNAGKGFLPQEALKPETSSVVLHTAVLEHLRFAGQIDALFRLVTDDGVMAVHTWVAEHIPQDPNWFYLLSVHCSFFTNAAMQVLFDRYGYRCSIYHVESRLWLWFKQPVGLIKPIIEKANARSGNHPKYIFAPHFVDYWKNTP